MKLKRAYPRNRASVRNPQPRKRGRVELDRSYESNFGQGNAARVDKKNDNRALSRIKAGSAASFVCELCEITGLTLTELRAHYRQYHGDRN
jgi:hypothetical protein